MSLCYGFRSIAVGIVLVWLAGGAAPRAAAFTVGRAPNYADQDHDASSPHEQQNELLQRDEIKQTDAKDESHHLKTPATTTTKDVIATKLENVAITNVVQTHGEGKSNSTTSTESNSQNDTTQSMETTTIDNFLETKTEGSSSHSYSSSADHHVKSELKDTTKHPESSEREQQSAESNQGGPTATPPRPVYSVAVPEPRPSATYTSIDRHRNNIDAGSSKIGATAAMTPPGRLMTEATMTKLTHLTTNYEDTTISLSSIFTDAPTVTAEGEQMTTDIFAPIEAEILSSKRGGYLDMTKHDPDKFSVITKIAKKNKGKTTPVGPAPTTTSSTTPRPTTTTTTSITSSTASSTTSSTASSTTAAAPVGLEYKAPEVTTKKVAGDEALNQLNEDAIREELLMEQILSDNEEIEFAKRHRGDRNTKNTTDSPDAGETSSESASEDLSVRPIAKDLYTVSPNYKRMKKLEVGPARPRLINPDDNSWRNESLSSRGIVFNANNSTKTFTQVIKNKTESVLSSVEQNASPAPPSPAPELRQRLEKLAEQRKKKKPYRSGESAEGEYDEYGYEPIFRQGGGYRSTIAPRPSAPPATPRATTEGRKSNVITTEKPRKLLNILEYFDTDDDEAFDYVTAPVDLKKEPPSSRPTPPPPPPRQPPPPPPPPRQPPPPPRPAAPQPREYPDRKPTLQYFPPRPYSKAPQVIDDDYDNHFKNKINQYTTKINEDFNTKVTTESYRNEHTTPLYKQQKELDRNLYYTNPGQRPDLPQSHAYHDNGYSRAAYTIRHLGDAATEPSAEPVPPAPARYTPPPPAPAPFTPQPLPPHSTLADYLQSLRQSAGGEDDYLLFKKEVLDQFGGGGSGGGGSRRALFPVLYNNSVVHQEFDGGRVLSSSFLRRLQHRQPAGGARGPLLEPRGCAACGEGEGAEGAPAPQDELAYYIPELEERQAIPG